jgi:hypothetical protein
LRRLAEELLDLARVEVLVRSRDHAVAGVADEAYVHLADEVVGVGDEERVLLDEAALEDVNAPVAVLRAPSSRAGGFQRTGPKGPWLTAPC